MLKYMQAPPLFCASPCLPFNNEEQVTWEVMEGEQC